MKAELEDNGVAVVPGLIPEDDCDNYITEYHQWLAKFGTGFPDNVTSIIHKYGVAHMEATWNIRIKVKPVFEGIWGTEKLLSSMDGVAIGQPPEISDTPFEVEGVNTLHHDQGGKKIGLHAYQGAVYLEEATEDDHCFMVIEKSHKYHTEFFNEFKSSRRSEFRKVNAKETAWFLEKGCTVKKVAVPKGGMVLWDSRTVHAGSPPKEGRENPGRWRYIAFVCMAPAYWADEEDMKLKKEVYQKLKCTRHWPAGGASAFRTGKSAFDIEEHGPVARSDAARYLAGDLEYDFSDGAPNGNDYRPQFKTMLKQ